MFIFPLVQTFELTEPGASIFVFSIKKYKLVSNRKNRGRKPDEKHEEKQHKI